MLMMTPMIIPTDILQQFDVPGPRYTSYPTADRFVEAYGETQYVQALQERHLNPRSVSSPLSLYVHVPFCASLCYYCACNKIITGNYQKALDYLGDLTREVELLLPYLGEAQTVSQVHLGGGTPTFFKDQELRTLVNMLQTAFHWQPGGEFSIEVDPRTVDEARLETLWNLGFNRLSLGVQDLENQVQQAVNRVQTMESIDRLMQTARAIGFGSINLDLIYGLPLQTQQSWQRTLNSVLAMKPDRLAMYGYAHLPARFKPQRHIPVDSLPSAKDKTGMLSSALQSLQDAGYVYIGMDHFALPNDSLSVAKRQGRLHRNFQGYSTRPDGDLIGLGVSAIGSMGASYVQNARNLEAYSDMLQHGRLPVVKGLSLTRDDLARRSIIMALMCQGRVELADIEQSHLLDFTTYFARELLQLDAFVQQGMVNMDAHVIQVTPLGWYLVRAIAMVFDKYAQADGQRAHFSKIL
jgi:oxygen-independent coproporphyrinogen-3 oxidase